MRHDIPHVPDSISNRPAGAGGSLTEIQLEIQSKMGAELRCQGCNCVLRSLYHRGMISPGTLVLLSAFPTPPEAPISSWGDQREIYLLLLWDS